MNGSRRDFLATGSALVLAGGAGCLGSDNPGSSGPRVFTSFFTLYEFTRNVAGEAITIDTAVPAGEHGHGWEPPTNLLPEIVEADAFVYLDADGFQPWAEDAAGEIEANYDDDVMLIDALEGIELLEYESDHHEAYDHDSTDHEYGSVAELELIDRDSGQVVAYYHFDHWHGTVPTLEPGAVLELRTRFLDGANERFPLDGDSYRVDARIDDRDSTESLELEAHDEYIRLEGNETDIVGVYFELWEGDERAWESAPITVTVDNHGDEPLEPDHGLLDVKFFSDPVLAQDGVRNIRDGLIELDPDNESVYEDNAGTYIDELEALHGEFRSELTDRDHDFVVLGAHDSFNYLGTRYGFEIETPVGLSPDDEPSSTDIAAAVDLIDEYEIEYVLWDYFDGERTAEAIVSESEHATETAMVTPAESYVEAWSDDGYGDYIGQMREINLPAFKKALGGE